MKIALNKARKTTIQDRQQRLSAEYDAVALRYTELSDALVCFELAERVVNVTQEEPALSHVSLLTWEEESDSDGSFDVDLHLGFETMDDDEVGVEVGGHEGAVHIRDLDVLAPLMVNPDYDGNDTLPVAHHLDVAKCYRYLLGDDALTN